MFFISIEAALNILIISYMICMKICLRDVLEDLAFVYVTTAGNRC